MVYPRQLQKEKYRFIPLGKRPDKLKEPIEKGWSGQNNYTYKDSRLLRYVRSGFNYGVLGGYGNLGIFDFDSLEDYKKYKSIFPKTFEVRTKRGYHLYFECEYVESFDFDGGEFRAKGRYCVGPNSRHPEGCVYLPNDEEITVLTKAEIMPLQKEVVSSYQNNVLEVSKPELYKRSWLRYNDKLELKEVEGKWIQVRICGVMPNLNDRGKHIIGFLVGSEFKWRELNRVNEKKLVRWFGYERYYWLNKEVFISAVPYVQGQKGTYQLVIENKIRK